MSTRERIAGPPLRYEQAVAMDVLAEHLHLDAARGASAYGCTVSELTEPEAAKLLGTLRGKLARQWEAADAGRAAAQSGAATSRVCARDKAVATLASVPNLPHVPRLHAPATITTAELAAACEAMIAWAEHARGEVTTRLQWWTAWTDAVELAVSRGVARDVAERQELAAMLAGRVA